MKTWKVIHGDYVTIVKAKELVVQGDTAIFYESDEVTSIVAVFKKFDSIFQEVK